MLKRREFIQQLTLLMGGTLSASGLLAMDGLDSMVAGATGDGSPFNNDLPLFTRIADIIIPRTETPGAADVGVGEFILDIVNQVLDDEEQAQFTKNLSLFKSQVKHVSSMHFMQLDSLAQVEWLTALNQDMLQKREDDTPFVDNGVAFFRGIKELTLLGFFTSEPGATKVLKYLAIPDVYRGSVPLSEIGGAWAES